MSKVAIVTDSNSGITQSEGNSLGVYVVPMPFFIEDRTYFEDINMNQTQFFDYLAEGEDILTSQPSLEELGLLWDDVLKENDELVYIPMSSGLSGSCNAATMLSHEDNYEGKVYVVDNQRISITQRRSVIDGVVMARNNFSAKEIHDVLMREKFNSSIYIMVDTLKYLKKGGRITPAAAAVGTMLKIRPVLQIQGEKLDAYSKVKTLKQAKNSMMKAIRNDLNNRFNDPEAKDYYIDIAYTQDDKDAMIFKEEIEKEFPDQKIHVAPLSLSVSCHIGPGALAVALSHKTPETIK